MPAGTIAYVVAIGGITLQKTTTKTGDNVILHGNGNDEISLPVGTLLADYQNDEDDTATGTLTGGHGLSTGVYDLYWAAGIRYGVSCTISTNAVDITDSGAGDALPVDDTPVIMSEQIQINCFIDGDALDVLVLNSTLRSHVEFLDSGDATIHNLELIADSPSQWHDTDGSANPYTGNPIATMEVSNGTTSAEAILTIMGLQDSTP